MHLFDSFLAREDCLVEEQILKLHPGVKHVIRMPRGWIFYEFHNELFAEPDFLVEGVWREKMERVPPLREKRIEMLRQQRALLKPWYETTAKMGDADALVASEICSYNIKTLTRMRWVDFLPCNGWGLTGQFTVALEGASAKPLLAVDPLLDEWRASGIAAGELRVDTIKIAKTSRLVKARCSYYTGHWLVALWVLLSDGRWNSQVRRMRVSLPHDISAGIST